MPHRFPAGADQPLYEIKANLFKALSHPARIRILEILCSSGNPTPVSTILADTGLEPTVLSQHLAVLKRHQVVTARRAANAVYYQLAHDQIAQLLLIARTFLADTLAANRDRLAALDSLPPIATGR